MFLSEGGTGRSDYRSRWMTEQEAGVMAGRDHKPSNVGGLQKLGKKGKETDSLIDPSEGTDPANSLTLAK